MFLFVGMIGTLIGSVLGLGSYFALYDMAGDAITISEPATLPHGIVRADQFAMVGVVLAYGSFAIAIIGTVILLLNWNTETISADRQQSVVA